MKYLHSYYGSSEEGLTNIRNDSVPLSISWKSINSNKILTLKLTWEEQYTTSKKEHHVINLPRMPLIHDLFIMAITPSPGAIILRHHERILKTLIAACKKKSKQPDSYLLNFKTKSLTTLMEHAGYFDNTDNFPQVTGYFFNSISEDPQKKANEEKGEHDKIHFNLNTMEKAWTISTYFIITALCPIPCALTFFTKSYPVKIWSRLKTYLEELITSTDKVTDEKPINLAWNIRYHKPIPVSELYIRNLELYKMFFEKSIYLKSQIEERLEVLKKEKTNRTNRRTGPFLKKEKIPSDKTKL